MAEGDEGEVPAKKEGDSQAYSSIQGRWRMGEPIGLDKITDSRFKIFQHELLSHAKIEEKTHGIYFKWL